MGFGFSCKCKNCNKEHEFMLGHGFLMPSFLDEPKENVLYICPECGSWNEKKIPFDSNMQKKCSKCKAEMKKYGSELSSEDLDTLPKMKCKKCGGELEIHQALFWD